MQFTMHLKNGVGTIRLWVKGVKHDKAMNPKSEEPGTLSGATGMQDCQSEFESADSTIPCGTSYRGFL